MKKLKKKMVCWLACLMMLLVFLGGCAGSSGEQQADAEWLQTASLDAHDTPEDLYAAALKEGGSLMVYTSTTRAMDTKESFEKAYPGLVVEIRDMSSRFIVDTLLEEYDTGRMQCDVVLCTDNSAAISGTLGAKGITMRYIPWDIADQLLCTSEESHLPFMTEAQVFCYNAAVWDEAPFSNIWELCDQRFNGKVYIPNPISSYSTYSLLMAIIQEDVAMRAAYQQLHGKPLDLPADESAGKEFLRRLLANGLVVTNSSDEVMEAVAAPGVEGEAVGCIISSKQRMNEVGYHLGIQYELVPFAGITSRNSVMVVTGTPRVNTAKLFIRWLLGETEGNGEGYRPFMKKGTWSVRTDAADGDEMLFEDINLLEPDKPMLKQGRQDFEAFWEDALETVSTGAGA